MSAPSITTNGLALSVRGLRKSFGAQEVLKGIDLDVRPGEIFVIMGRSGSGKTVLLKHLIGLEHADAGQVLVNDHSITSPEVLEKFRMAMVFQSGALLNSLNVGENVGLYLSEHRTQPPAEIARIVAEKLAVVGLQGAEEKLPSELSGGMKKRVALARALVIEPQMLLYDEPTSELDPLMAITIGQEIERLNRRTGVTSLVVTHDRDLAFGIADRIAFMHEGKLLAIGTPAEMRATSDPVLKEFLTASFKTAE
ncbi:MAG: Sulfate/thiosulfate import ATP-binding protein CysA [Verrucomicrobiota bacterium]|jgi:phospholipid/cholesterol/gamma-HCH transport system ATP-binding protein